MAVDSARPDRIGIVTVLYNSADVVDDFFASLARQHDVSFKLYVIDNSATPETLERCRELAVTHGIAADFVFNNANLGVAKGNNQGIERALQEGCTHVLLANNDTEFAAGTLARLLQTAREGEQIVTPKILYYGPQRLIWYAGGRIDSWVMRTPHLGMLQPDRGQYDRDEYTGYAPTCFLLVSSAVFDSVGLMDETYFVYYDDTDFMWRLRRSGLRIRYTPAAIVEHKVSTSTGGAESPFTLYYTSRNRIYFIRKNFAGLRRWVALAYTLVTRSIRSVSLPRALSRRMWDGIKDGFRLSVSASVS